VKTKRNAFNRLFYVVVKYFFWFCFKIYNRMSVQWQAPLPEGNRFIVASNHCSLLDPLLVGIAFPGPLRFLAKEELFQPLLLRTLVYALGAVPVSRVDERAAAVALKQLYTFLEEGESVVLFPEGQRSFDGKLLPLEGGTALIALRSGVPILPVYIGGTWEAMPVGSKWVRPVKISVTFGKALIPNLHEGENHKAARERLTEQLSQALSALEETGFAQRR
jgi:1-acyl-sn-glycerol-3-phosphate acyltransferase